MANQPHCVARVNRQELTDLPCEWNNPERGTYLRLLFQLKGIDPDRFYQVTYHPLPRCWLLTQEAAPGPTATGATTPTARAAEQFYLEALAEFRSKARAACAALAAHSLHFARFGCAYRLPEQAQELTPADLANQLGGSPPSGGTSFRFDNEGGWKSRPSEN
jgi:hypothetical protein